MKLVLSGCAWATSRFRVELAQDGQDHVEGKSNIRPEDCGSPN